MIAGIVAQLLIAMVLTSPVQERRPNILWISTEDISPDLACYGDGYAITPNLDKLASQGVRYTNAFAVAPVCAPSRSSIITGMYPTTIGSMHMRSKAVPPPHVKAFTEYLRAAGYYCTNNSKTDYNFEPPPSHRPPDTLWTTRAIRRTGEIVQTVLSPSSLSSTLRLRMKARSESALKCIQETRPA